MPRPSIPVETANPTIAQREPIENAFLFVTHNLTRISPEDVRAQSRSSKQDSPKEGELPPLPCDDYLEVVGSWEEAMEWREELEQVLQVMLAVALSTAQVGDQLFLMTIGSAGSGKTRFCDALLTSPFCHALEHLTGFHSGYKGPDPEKSYSLIDRINLKTLITPEGDTLISSANFKEIMGQQRRIFDGVTGATFKNQDTDNRQTGLRTPWIMAGTYALLATDQSKLGDRFLKVFIGDPDEDQRRAILRRVAESSLASVKITSNAKPETRMTPEMTKAYQLTGGYVDYLRKNSELIFSRIEASEEFLWLCGSLGEFTALLRARPDKESEHESAELPTRLTSQFVRLGVCLAGVTQRREVDAEHIETVRKVAFDTCSGSTRKIVDALSSVPNRGKEQSGLEKSPYTTFISKDQLGKLLRFLKKIGVVEKFKPPKAHLRWKLTEKMRRLYEEVHNDE